MEIWGRTTSSNVQKVLWCGSELNLSYQRYDVGGEFGANRTPEYLAMNPNGLVPMIRDGNLVIWESNTIMRYLASRYDGASLYPQALDQRSDVDRWLDWQLSTLAPAIFPVFWGLIRTSLAERDNEAIAAATAYLTEVWRLLDHELSRRKYAAGNQLTLADIAFGSSIHRWFALPIERPNFVHLKAWHDLIAVRPGFREHIAKPLV